MLTVAPVREQIGPPLPSPLLPRREEREKTSPDSVVRSGAVGSGTELGDAPLNSEVTWACVNTLL